MYRSLSLTSTPDTSILSMMAISSVGFKPAVDKHCFSAFHCMKHCPLKLFHFLSQKMLKNRLLHLQMGEVPGVISICKSIAIYFYQTNVCIGASKHMYIVKIHWLIVPISGNPSCLHTTWASSVLQ